MADLNLDDEFPEFGSDDTGSTTKRAGGLGVAARVAAQCLDRTLKGSGPAIWHGPVGSLSVMRVPNEAWITPMQAALGAKESGLVVLIAKRDRRGRLDGPDPVALAERVALGRHAVVLTALDLPADLTALADRKLTIARPDRGIVGAVIRAVTGQRARSLIPEDLAGVDLAAIVAAIREGATAAECVARLRRAAKALTTPIDRPDVPEVVDLAGYGAAGEWARDVVAEAARLRNGEAVKFASAIFYGPPGTGKTSLAASIAKSARLPLVETSIARWFSTSEGHLGDVIKAADSFFDAAAAAAPCVAFLDELDALPDRAALSDRGRDWWTTVVTAVLAQVERMRRLDPPVLLVAATNRIEGIDAALRRPGRFDRQILIDPPDEDGLIAILAQRLGRAIADDDLRRVARLGVGATGAAAVAWIENARRRAREEDRPLAIADLLDEVVPPDPRPSALRRRIALHEAGHAVAALAYGHTVERVTIVGDGSVGGSTALSDDRPLTRASIEAHLTVALAGRAADELLGEGADAGAVADLARATKYAAACHLQLGLREKLTHRDGDIDRALRFDPALAAAVEQDLQAAMERARAIVMSQRDLVMRIADALVHHRVLDTDDIARLHRAWRTARRRAEGASLAAPAPKK